MANSFCKFTRGHSKDGSTNRVVKLKCEIYVPRLEFFLGCNQQPPNPQEGYCNQIQDKIHPPNPRKVHGVITSRSSWWRCKDMLLMVPWAGMAVVSAVTATVTCINRHARSNIARGYWTIQMFQKLLYEKLRGSFLPWMRNFKMWRIVRCHVEVLFFVFWDRRTSSTSSQFEC